jgi:hypothetical protein
MKNLCIRESYIKDGQEKVSWNKIGIMFDSKDKQYIKLFHIPGVLIGVFEQKKKEEAPAAKEATTEEAWLEEENIQ